ncbi:uncharacterized protein BDZ99DRAFT_259484 [Mytilinidion resinicola]|uniref:Uncharacterized protein n=1 Tax=Mytilinidion resinicola TaxID=574789 RepID=A0A6A6YYT6_9PEZI|nr:uncharacterized protein BDZ99DRAFT_259484 [Mytilinidion resinicola]KAF2813603.1 hypothetical protein BDZ99DRAFT_259484 [Mytilinidion resinicola]
MTMFQFTNGPFQESSQEATAPTRKRKLSQSSSRFDCPYCSKHGYKTEDALRQHVVGRPGMKNGCRDKFPTQQPLFAPSRASAGPQSSASSGSSSVHRSYRTPYDDGLLPAPTSQAIRPPPTRIQVGPYHGQSVNSPFPLVTTPRDIPAKVPATCLVRVSADLPQESTDLPPSTVVSGSAKGGKQGGRGGVLPHAASPILNAATPPIRNAAAPRFIDQFDSAGTFNETIQKQFLRKTETIPELRRRLTLDPTPTNRMILLVVDSARDYSTKSPQDQEDVADHIIHWMVTSGMDAFSRPYLEALAAFEDLVVALARHLETRLLHCSQPRMLNNEMNGFVREYGPRLYWDAMDTLYNAEYGLYHAGPLLHHPDGAPVV